METRVPTKVDFMEGGSRLTPYGGRGIYGGISPWVLGPYRAGGADLQFEHARERVLGFVGELSPTRAINRDVCLSDQLLPHSCFIF